MSGGGTVRVSVNELRPDHLTAFKTALSNVLSTPLAEGTFAQIIDGLPTLETWHAYSIYPNTHILSHHELCPGSLEVAIAFREKVSPDALQFDASTAQAYQNTSIGSREFTLRLMEMIAIACHDIAALLFNNADGGLHQGCQTWKPDPSTLGLLVQVELPPTVFFHADYDAYDQYPQGLADMVGYWAEYRLFGGVVLFDRGDSDADCKDVFLHPVMGYRIFQLSEFQIQQFTDFALTPPQYESSSPLPFRAERLARRVDPYDAMSLHIFRNRYERRVPENRPHNCVPWLDDYPEMQDHLRWLNERDSAGRQH